MRQCRLPLQLAAIHSLPFEFVFALRESGQELLYSPVKFRFIFEVMGWLGCKKQLAQATLSSDISSGFQVENPAFVGGKDLQALP